MTTSRSVYVGTGQREPGAQRGLDRVGLDGLAFLLHRERIGVEIPGDQHGIALFSARLDLGTRAHIGREAICIGLQSTGSIGTPSACTQSVGQQR